VVVDVAGLVGAGVFPAGAQVTTVVSLSAHDARGSPSPTVRVNVAAPGVVPHVKVGFCAVASLSVPAVVLQAKDSALGPASLSCAAAERAMVPPTWTSAGFAPMPSIVGQMLSVPLTIALPRRVTSWQVNATATGAVLPASTLNVAEPRQLANPSVVTAVRLIWKPVPAGSPGMVAVSFVDADTLMVPILENPFPLMV